MHGPSSDPHDQPTSTKVFVSICLISIQFLAMTDATSIDGIVPLIQKNFHINDAQTGIIKTSATVTHTAVLALVWLLGDSFERRKLFLTSISLWILFSFLSIILGSRSFLIFVAFKSLGAAASSIFGVLVQVMLADLFRGKALGIAIMSMAVCDILAGNVISIVNSWIVSNNFPWQSGLIAAPLIALAPLFALSFVRRSFRSIQRQEKQQKILSSAFGIFSNKSFLLITASIALGMFNERAFGFWFPSMVYSAWESAPEAFNGLSYTQITTFNTSVQMAGLVLGMPLALWIAQSWYHGTGPFSLKTSNNRAYPIVYLSGAILSTTMFISCISIIDKNYMVCLVSLFLKGIGSAAVSLCQQMLLMVIPASSRAAAVALSRLVSGMIGIPAAQFAGMISDAVRGDSTLPNDRFHAYQVGLLGSALFAVASTICDAVLVIFFPRDCELAEETKESEKDEEFLDEHSTLIGMGKGRRESIFETIARSRATTVTSLW